MDNRRTDVAITRLCTGHAGVGEHLARFGMLESSICDACNVVDSIEHFLLHCQKYQHERAIFKVEIGRVVRPADFTVKNLLGGGDKSNAEKRMIRKLAKFLTSIEKVKTL